MQDPHIDAPPAGASTKNVTTGGAKVTTFAGEHHSSSKEPESVTIQADPATSLGLSFAVGGVVRQASPSIPIYEVTEHTAYLQFDRISPVN